MKSKSYKQGYQSYEKGLKWIDNPYEQGSRKWEDWNRGRSDIGDIGFRKLIKAFPQLLKGS